MSSYDAMGTEIDNLMSTIGKQVKRSGNKHVIPVVVQLLYDVMVSVETRVCARHQFADEARRSEEYFAAKPSGVPQTCARHSVEISEDPVLTVGRKFLVGNIERTYAGRPTAPQQFFIDRAKRKHVSVEHHQQFIVLQHCSHLLNHCQL